MTGDHGVDAPVGRIVVRGLRVGYGGARVLDDLDLVVPAGAVTAVLGRSGCGKSTLLRALAGLIRPESGEILLGGEVVSGPSVFVPPERRRVGLVPQEGALFPHLDVAGNVGFGLRGRDRAGRVADLLALVGMQGTQSMRPSQLSGGMQQRIAVARALARRPQVVLLDEPFSALDAGLRDSVRADVLEAIRLDGATAVLVTHDQDEALSSADRVAVMRSGRILQEGAPLQVYAEPADLDTALFVGEAVTLDATVVESGPGPSVVVRTGRCAIPATCSTGAAGEGDTGILLLRPEHLALRDRDDDAAGPSLGSATVVSVRYHGHDCLVTAALQAGGRVTVRTMGVPPPDVGALLDVAVTSRPRFFAGPAARPADAAADLARA